MDMHPPERQAFLYPTVAHRAFETGFSKQIQHDCRQYLIGFAQWQPANCPQVLLKLAGRRAVDRMMAAVVRAWRDFVHQQVAIVCQKHFHCQQSADVEGSNDLFGKGLGTGGDKRGNTGRQINHSTRLASG